jgi:hypothetical protein
MPNLGKLIFRSEAYALARLRIMTRDETAINPRQRAYAAVDFDYFFAGSPNTT